MRLRLGGVRRALVVAPHPDDEVIGAAGLIGALRTRGCEVRVIVVSDGAASHPGSRSWPKARLVAARRRESLCALRRLSITSSKVRFLGLPDGALTVHGKECRRKLRQALVQMEADVIVAPALSDAHPDHQEVAAALAVRRGRARRLSYQVWPPRHRRGARTLTLVAPGGAARKRSLIRVHRTQLGVITDDPSGFAIAPHELALFARPIECFREERP